MSWSTRQSYMLGTSPGFSAPSVAPLILRDWKRHEQPQGPVEVDWASYPTCSLAVSQYYDFAAKALLSKTGTKLSPATNGIVTGFGSTSGVSSTDKVTTTLTRYAQRRTYLVVALANGSGAGGSFGRMFEKRTSGAQSELFYRDDTGGLSHYARVFSGSAGQWAFTSPSVGQWHVYIVRYDSGSTSNVPVIWVDGVAKTLTVVSSPSGTPLDNSDPYTIGNRASDNLRNWSGQIALVSAFDSILTDAQCAALTANPWQLFKPRQQRIWVGV